MIPGSPIPAPHERTAMPLADISFGELLLTVFWIFLFVAWIWILVAIFTDLFRNHEMSGGVKAAWVLLLVLIPFITGLIYLIIHGDEMRSRELKSEADTKAHFDEYVREQAHAGSPADELHKLNELKEKGALSAEEFEKAKAKLLS
jgi:hypothetical protein